jgi:hypothetical protein
MLLLSALKWLSLPVRAIARSWPRCGDTPPVFERINVRSDPGRGGEAEDIGVGDALG